MKDRVIGHERLVGKKAGDVVATYDGTFLINHTYEKEDKHIYLALTEKGKKIEYFRKYEIIQDYCIVDNNQNISNCPRCNSVQDQYFTINILEYYGSLEWNIGVAACGVCGYVVPFKSYRHESPTDEAIKAWNNDVYL